MIYFIQSGGSDFVKIGYCKGDPKSRLGQLQVGNPERLELISVKDGDKDIEAILHSKFEHLRVRGEWFKWNADLRDFARPLLKRGAGERKGGRVVVARGSVDQRYCELLGITRITDLP